MHFYVYAFKSELLGHDPLSVFIACNEEPFPSAQFVPIPLAVRRPHGLVTFVTLSKNKKSQCWYFLMGTCHIFWQCNKPHEPVQSTDCLTPTRLTLTPLPPQHISILPFTVNYSVLILVVCLMHAMKGTSYSLPLNPQPLLPTPYSPTLNPQPLLPTPYSPTLNPQPLLPTPYSPNLNPQPLHPTP
jgi:hypothetical protein